MSNESFHLKTFHSLLQSWQKIFSNHVTETVDPRKSKLGNEHKLDQYAFKKFKNTSFKNHLMTHYSNKIYFLSYFAIFVLFL